MIIFINLLKAEDAKVYIEFHKKSAYFALSLFYFRHVGF